jgi:hypothetical protein
MHKLDQIQMPRSELHLLPPQGQTMKSASLSRKKQMMDMRDGDEHFVSLDSTVGPINELYLNIREFSAFPFGNGRMNLIHNTQENAQ